MFGTGQLERFQNRQATKGWDFRSKTRYGTVSTSLCFENPRHALPVGEDAAWMVSICFDPVV